MANQYQCISRDFQKTRVESSNRALMNSERNGISKDDLKKYGVDSIYTKAKSFEEDIKKLLEKDLQYKPLYTEYLKFVTGMGAVLTAGAMAYIGDIKRFPKISSLWQYCGYGANTICEECSTDKKKFWDFLDDILMVYVPIFFFLICRSFFKWLSK